MRSEERRVGKECWREGVPLSNPSGRDDISTCSPIDKN